MTGSVTNIRAVRIRLVKVSYACDLTVANGAMIPLGVMADLDFDGWDGLGLTGRLRLEQEELDKIAPLYRGQLESPFSFLMDDYYGHLRNSLEAGGLNEAFSALSSAGHSSVVFTPMKPARYPLSQKIDLTDYSAVKIALSSLMVKEMTNQYDRHVQTADSYQLQPIAA